MKSVTKIFVAGLALSTAPAFAAEFESEVFETRTVSYDSEVVVRAKDLRSVQSKALSELLVIEAPELSAHVYDAETNTWEYAAKTESES